MSIFPVPLAEWYPAKPKPHDWATSEDQRNWHDNAKTAVEMAGKCCVCGKDLEFSKAWGMHSIPFGYGWEELWCSEECVNAPPIAEARKLIGRDDMSAHDEPKT